MNLQFLEYGTDLPGSRPDIAKRKRTARSTIKVSAFADNFS